MSSDSLATSCSVLSHDPASGDAAEDRRRSSAAAPCLDRYARPTAWARDLRRSSPEPQEVAAFLFDSAAADSQIVATSAPLRAALEGAVTAKRERRQTIAQRRKLQEEDTLEFYVAPIEVEVAEDITRARHLRTTLEAVARKG